MWIVRILVVVCVVLIWRASRDMRRNDVPASTIAVSPVAARPSDPSPRSARAFAVVDVKRILGVLAKSRPPEEFNAAMASEVRQIVAALAMERNLDLVFDRSGRSKHEIPVVLVSPAIADLTDAAIERLGP